MNGDDEWEWGGQEEKERGRGVDAGNASEHGTFLAMVKENMYRNF